MRVPVWLAWGLLASGCFTAGLLRQFHDRTPASPYVPYFVGSLLFGVVLLLLLVSAREWRCGGAPGAGVRLGNLTPLLLMLFVEKWASTALYLPIFSWITPWGLSDAELDARFRLFAGVGLILVCLLVSRFSAPASRRTWLRARASRWAPAAAGTLGVVGVTYTVLWGLARSLGGELELAFPPIDRLLIWVLLGQALLAFGEELYFRGLLMSELERLTPRLGLHRPAARRWLAVLATSLMFGMEHIMLGSPWVDSARRMAFTVSLGLLLGILVAISDNLHFAAGLHAWINWLLLGAAPVFTDAVGRPSLPAGTYIGLAMILAFVLAWLRGRDG